MLLGDEKVKDYRVEIKVKNNYLSVVMQRHGYTTVAELSRACGVSQQALGTMLNLKTPAYTKRGELTASVTQLCNFFGCGVDELFPMQHLEESLECNQTFLEANREELQTQSLLARVENPSNLLEQGDTKRLLATTIGLLTAREQRVINLRFGLGAEDEHTLQEIGDMFSLSKERVRSIESKALRKLRHPINSAYLYAAMDKGFQADFDAAEKRRFDREMEKLNASN
jgi:hypothetical protein